jgi:hypothetical protein
LIAKAIDLMDGWIAGVTALTGGWIARVTGSTPGWIAGVIAWTTVSTDAATAPTGEWIGVGIKGTFETIAGRTVGANPDRICPLTHIGNSGRISSDTSKGMYAG